MPEELLLLVFLHGFKGGADTFGEFPARVQHILSQAQPRVEVQAVVYPPYDTRGELVTAADNHVIWLTTLIAERKSAFKGTGPVRVVLLGHSMGGLVIADTVLSTLSSDALPILGVIAYDSPFLGLHPAVFKNTFDKALGLASQGQAALAALGVGYGLFKSATGSSGATTPPSAPMSSTSASTSRSADKEETEVAPTAEKPAVKSSWLSFSTVASIAAAAGAVGAAGAAYYNRETIQQHVNWATSHLSFVGELWKTTELEKRTQELVQASEKGVGFHCFYTLLPPTAANANERTFCLLPHTPPIRACFTPNTNSHASDEITAHIEMFTEKSDGMYELGSRTCSLLGEWLNAAREGRMGQAKAAQLGKEKEKEKVERWV